MFIMKIILILISTMFILLSCSSIKTTPIINNTSSSLVNEINESIIDGFFDGDTTGRNLSGVYFLKNDSINSNDFKKSLVSKD